jgi:NTE family protein
MAARPNAAQRAPEPAVRRINLALQGGGAHGAFAWGVIDRLLEQNDLAIESIVGTSAGAMNAVVTAHGLATGGPQAARDALRVFWRRVSLAARRSPLQPTWWDRRFRPGSLDGAPGWMLLDAMSRVFSPYQLNPLNYNPLREVLAATVDCARLRQQEQVKLFICASNVKTGRIRVFDHTDISIDAVMASACLPFLFQAVEIDGEHYWDGGYMGNPPIYPLIYNAESRDVLIVQLNPIRIDEVPRTAQAILDRVNTLSFNSSLMREMRAIQFVTKLVDRGFDDNGRLKRMLIHSIDAEDVMASLGVSSKLNADWDFLVSLHDLGRQRADAFLALHADKIGRESSTVIEEKFL